MKTDEQIFTDPMPNDPQGLIEWVPEATRVERCGDHTSKWVKDRCCRRLFRFRACRIQGGIVRATVCQQCTLEYDVILGSEGERRSRLSQLARFRNCDLQEALTGAELRWGDLKPKPKPKEESLDLDQELPQEPRPRRSKKDPPQQNLPYKDD